MVQRSSSATALDEGIDFALEQLCQFLGVDPTDVSWDAATETTDGDVRSVIGNILRTKFGEDWGPNAPAQASPASKQMHVDLRRLAIVQRHVPAYGGTTVHVGYACKVCQGEWDRDAPEFHALTCTAVSPMSSTQIGCGDPGCKDPNCDYGKGPNTDPLSSTKHNTP